METQQEISYLKKIIELQDKLLDCYESDDETTKVDSEVGEGELSYVKKIVSLQTKVLESYETDSDSEEETELEKSVYHDSSFYVSDILCDYLGRKDFPDRKEVIACIIRKLKDEDLVDSDNNIQQTATGSNGLYSVVSYWPTAAEPPMSIFSLPKYIEHHFSG